MAPVVKHAHLNGMKNNKISVRGNILAHVAVCIRVNGIKHFIDQGSRTGLHWNDLFKHAIKLHDRFGTLVHEKH